MVELFTNKCEYELVYTYNDNKSKIYKRVFKDKSALNEFVDISEGSLNIIDIKDVLKNDCIIGYVRISQVNNYEFKKQQSKMILDKYPSAIIVNETANIYEDTPELKNIFLNSNCIDTLVFTSLDRICKNARNGLDLIQKLLENGVKTHVLNMGIVSDDDIGRVILGNIKAFVELENCMLTERLSYGKSVAKGKNGFTEGRPRQYEKGQLDYALSLLSVNSGTMSYAEVSKLVNISKSTLIREQRERSQNK